MNPRVTRKNLIVFYKLWLRGRRSKNLPEQLKSPLKLEETCFFQPIFIECTCLGGIMSNKQPKPLEEIYAENFPVDVGRKKETHDLLPPIPYGDKPIISSDHTFPLEVFNGELE